MISDDDLQELTDQIYEAAVVPDLWPGVLANLSRLADGSGGLLFTANLDRMKWTASPDIYPLLEEFIRDGWMAINPRPRVFGGVPPACFVRDNDVFTEEQMAADPVYTGFYRKRGLGYAAGTMLNVPSGDAIIFSFERAWAKGPVEPRVIEVYDQLRPHLARAALMGARLGLETARAMTQALAQVGLPAAVLKAGGQLYATNPLFEAQMPALCYDRPTRLTFSDPAIDALFAAGVEGLKRASTAAGQVCSIPVPARDDEVPLIIHLLPVRRAAGDIFSQATSLVIVTPVDRGAVPTAEVVAGLFDLSPAEARIARGIAEGHTVEAIALTAGVSRETVRTQLKAVLAKTGMSRQSDLVALLGGLRLPGG